MFPDSSIGMFSCLLAGRSQTRGSGRGRGGENKGDQDGGWIRTRGIRMGGGLGQGGRTARDTHDMVNIINHAQ